MLGRPNYGITVMMLNDLNIAAWLKNRNEFSGALQAKKVNSRTLTCPP
jgi:hypothetical protein